MELHHKSDDNNPMMRDIANMIIKKEKKKREPHKLVIINEDELIRQVEIRPILFDKSLKGYRKSSLRDQSWKEIATLLDSTVEECRKRWRSLRDAFSKHYKQGDNSNAKKKKWIFYDQMYFIAPYLDYPSGSLQETNLQDDSTDNVLVDSGNLEMDHSSPYKTRTEENQNPHQHHQDDHTTIDLYDENQVMTRIFASPVYPATDNKKINSEKTEDYTPIMTTDPDERFLLSCSPILKRLSNKKNALARLRIQQILYGIEFGEQ